MSGESMVVIGGQAGGSRAVHLSTYLDGRAADLAESEANAWIKSLRHARVDGRALRERFTYRGDSLWWFAELYLHKGRVIIEILRAILALEALIERERPTSLTLIGGGRVIRTVGPLVATRRGVDWRLSRKRNAEDLQLRLSIGARSAFYALSALAERFRPAGAVGARRAPTRVAAFVHSAFWRADAGEETYIGPVLHEVAARVGGDHLQLVGLGPRTNFRQRRWQHRMAEFGDPLAREIPLTPVQAYASWSAVRHSFGWWTRRRTIQRALLASDDLRRAAVIRGCDCWALVRGELSGISHLQFPWSTRAMDEAGASLDALEPTTVVTYAEAGGWGRALILEARRRRIPTVGLQHGFIYRHWLNYRHEPDEMEPSPANPDDRGFPRPDVTVVYDRFAARYLVDAGHFPPAALSVAGSPRLDAFVETARRLTDGDRERIRASVGARPGQHVVVVATKYTQMAGAFGALVAAVEPMPDVRLVVKCHPAETAGPYQRAAAGVANVVIAPPHADLAGLISVARLLVTVNSTAAIEAMPLEVPALVIASPSNLSPFVEAGAVAGVASPDEIRPALTSLLYDEECRSRLAAGRKAFMLQYGVGADGLAAARAADVIVQLAPRP
jgi:hypothetical protein